MSMKASAPLDLVLNPNSFMFKRYVSLQNPGHLLQDRHQ